MLKQYDQSYILTIFSINIDNKGSGITVTRTFLRRVVAFNCVWLKVDLL